MKSVGVFALVIFMAGNLSCSARTAITHGSPPTLPTVSFKAELLTGAFSTVSAPITFLWPMTDDSGQPLNYDGQVDMQAKIIASSALAEESMMAAGRIELELVEPYYVKFVGLKCGLLVDDFFSTPDARHRSVADTDWKTPETPAEEVAIKQCQQIQNERKQVFKEKVGPLLQVAKEAQTHTLQLIGNENFLPIQKLSIVFAAQPQVTLSGFQGLDEEFSTEATKEIYRISGVQLNVQEGWLTFVVPAIRLENEVKDLQTGQTVRRDFLFYGHFTFKVEFSPVKATNLFDGGLQIGGEVILHNNVGGGERRGRFSATGVAVR